MTNRTKKGTFKKGHSGNPLGRPKGSRNKSSLIKAQISLDNTSETAAKLFEAVISRDPTKLSEFGLAERDVNLKAMLEAAKIVMGHAAGQMKALEATEKKDSEKDKGAELPKRPVFQTVASISKAS